MRAMRFWSALSTITSLSSWRLRLVAFEVRMWRFIEWPRLIFPVAVFLKRFAAPLWVFIFGITSFHYNINARSPPAMLHHGDTEDTKKTEKLWAVSGLNQSAVTGAETVITAAAVAVARAA